jgi:hypothetical protein
MAWAIALSMPKTHQSGESSGITEFDQFGSCWKLPNGHWEEFGSAWLATTTIPVSSFGDSLPRRSCTILREPRPAISHNSGTAARQIF